MSDNLETVYSTTNVMEAEYIKMTLEGEGIRCLLENENQAGFTGIFEIKVDVLSSSVDRARQIIDEIRESSESHDDSDDTEEE
ncbi:putative signal transducing protein [Gimesia panareensis]|uniref:Uncharacterized protein n=1 Tax=Gimesia panareensis TaxID=2527978 RepID=A0A518FSW7_9PLAN|nr:DUF2007 domain-containing protein [Gimesia panareensis]QDU51521.1 hypothetical protein Pan110_38870 [Gimesia panareensis]QDV19410.1 hypothetical protein Pan153_40750 [Gimesia panareensis]